MAEQATVLEVPTDVGAMLASMAGTESKSRKSNVPRIANHEELADRACRAKQNYKQAETEWQMVEDEVLQVARGWYAQLAQKGDFTKSLQLVGSQTGGVTVRFSDRFSAVLHDRLPQLRDELGDRFDSYFAEERVLTLKQTDDDTIRLLLETLGPDTFRAIFEVKVKYVPKKGMDRAQFDLPEQVQHELRQNKPSVVAA